jgi:hypothetical protein
MSRDDTTQFRERKPSFFGFEERGRGLDSMTA